MTASNAKNAHAGLAVPGGDGGGRRPSRRRMLVMGGLVLGIAAFFLWRDQRAPALPAARGRAMPPDAEIRASATPYQLLMFLPADRLEDGSAADTALGALLATTPTALAVRAATAAEAAQWQVTERPVLLFLREGRAVARLTGPEISAPAVLAAWRQAQLPPPVPAAP